MCDDHFKTMSRQENSRLYVIQESFGFISFYTFCRFQYNKHEQLSIYSFLQLETQQQQQYELSDEDPETMMAIPPLSLHCKYKLIIKFVCSFLASHYRSSSGVNKKNVGVQ
jgi:hypothetical protein